MILGKFKILKNYITACDDSFILSEIKKRISEKENVLISPIASYTLALAFFDEKLQTILDKFTYLLPDSQWIRISMKFLYGTNIKETITGTELMLKVCGFAQKNNYKISLYGTTEKTNRILKVKLIKKFPKLSIVYSEPSKFREITPKEKLQLIRNIQQSNADILFVALGSPLQEIFSSNFLFGKPRLGKPIVIIPVGAAFDFISGVKSQAPKWLQQKGCEWLFRLIYEPKRLWKRYLIYGPIYIILIIRQKISLLLPNILKN